MADIKHVRCFPEGAFLYRFEKYEEEEHLNYLPFVSVCHYLERLEFIYEGAHPAETTTKWVIQWVARSIRDTDIGTME